MIFLINLVILFKLHSVVCFTKFSDDIYLNSSQLIQKYNYTVETHVVVTEDGYKLNTFRIPNEGLPVLLVHGIGDSSDCWLVLGPEHSMAYPLADAGFDIWIFNARGNRYNKEHTENVSQERFWSFSYDEIGTHDVPATINYILSITRYSKLTYIGFSQGTTAFFVMCSLRPEFNDKIDHAILLAPVAWLKFTKYPLIDFFSQNLDRLTWLAEKQGVYEVFPFNEKLNAYHSVVCDTLSPVKFLCELELFLNFGVSKLTNLLSEKLQVITTHIPAGTSSKVFLHYIQGYATKQFQKYDYGTKRNMKIYSSAFPPIYDVSLVSVPITMFASAVDWFSDVEDVRILRNKLKSVVKFVEINESLQFTHLEFVYGARVNSIINKPILKILENLRLQ